MLFQDITILDENLDVREHMYVGTKAERIAYIGTEMPEEDFGEIYPGDGRLLMSGFYNAHAHSPMALMRGYGENLALQDWLNTRIFPFEDKLTGEAVYWGTMLCMAESLRFGIVSSSDMYYFCGDMARAVVECGAKANISRSLVTFDDTDIWDLDRFLEARDFLRDWNGAGGGRVVAEMSLHAEYTNQEKAARQVAEFTRESGARMHVHISETKSEHEECKARRNGRTPIQFFDSLGLLDQPVTAAHCVWVDDEDIAIMAEKGVTVSSCPASNMKLASGVCNAPKLLASGVNLAIGTDSVASNNSLNFLEELKLFALVQKVHHQDPTVITPKQALYAGTRAGALTQGREDCGLLRQGFRADLIVLDIAQPHMHPVHNLLNNVIYSADGRDVVLTMVDGKVLYRGGDLLTIDMEKTVAEVERATQNILRQL
ncbi:amidohydrolase [Bacilliculturomica massiliensis]|uniref:amidohydrolase n=1 Tax=Bacilliculturomica massiliensis TaxID=1917867 RepID=UPI00103009FD|nr:amidohydrolase [Bacilliculturomica massiliensis]